MKIGEKYVGLGLGDSSEEVRKLKTFMRKKFSYARSLADTTLFDDAMTAAVAEMQSRYQADGKLPAEKYLPGVVNAETKYVMGFIPRPPGPDLRPVLLTVCGTGVPWWVGPDADVARAVEGKYKWRPVGYRAAPFPMGTSVAEGRGEAARILWEERQRIEAHGLAMIGYSQGAIVTGELWEYDIKPEGAPLHWVLPHLQKAVTFGNPMREKGKVSPDFGGSPIANPESFGIADRLMVDTPGWWRNYAHDGDLYSDVEGESGENKTAIYKIVMGQRIFSGPDSILRQVIEVLGVGGDASQLTEIIAIFKAIMDAGMFFVRGTGPHVNYSVGPAIEFLRS